MPGIKPVFSGPYESHPGADERYSLDPASHLTRIAMWKSGAYPVFYAHPDDLL